MIITLNSWEKIDTDKLQFIDNCGREKGRVSNQCKNLREFKFFLTLHLGVSIVGLTRYKDLDQLPRMIAKYKRLKKQEHSLSLSTPFYKRINYTYYLR